MTELKPKITKEKLNEKLDFHLLNGFLDSLSVNSEYVVLKFTKAIEQGFYSNTTIRVRNKNWLGWLDSQSEWNSELEKLETAAFQEKKKMAFLLYKLKSCIDKEVLNASLNNTSVLQISIEDTVLNLPAVGGDMWKDTMQIEFETKNQIRVQSDGSLWKE